MGQSVSTSSYMGPDGRQITKTTTTIRNADGTTSTETKIDGDKSLESQLPRSSFGRHALGFGGGVRGLPASSARGTAPRPDDRSLGGYVGGGSSRRPRGGY